MAREKRITRRGGARGRAGRAKESGVGGGEEMGKGAGEEAGEKQRQRATVVPEGVRGGEGGRKGTRGTDVERGRGAEGESDGGKRDGTREDGGNLSVTRRASGNERTPGNVYVLHKEGPPLVSPFCFRARARARALVPLFAAPRCSAPRPPPYVSNPSRTYDATHVQRVPKVPRCLPACLLACLPALPALPACLAWLVCLPPACLRRASGSLRENRAFVGYIGGYTRKDHDARVAGRSTS